VSAGSRRYQRTLRAVICGALATAWFGLVPLSAQDAPSPDYQRLFSVALARLEEGRPVAAQWWLRRAFRHAQTDAERALLRTAFRRIADANPLRLSFGGSVTPTSNINGGSAQDYFTLEGLPFLFEIPPDGRALSGTEFAGYLDLSYRLARGPKYKTSLDLYLYGRTYRLSSEAQAEAPLVSGSDFAYFSGDLALRHRWIMLDGLGPTSVSASLGRVDHGGEPLYRYHRVVANQEFRWRRVLLSLGASYEDQETQSTERLDAKVVETRAAFSLKTAKGGLWRVTLMDRRTRSLLASDTFQEMQAGVSMTPSWRVYGVVPTLTLGLGAKDYDDFILSLDGRRDRSVSIGLSLTLDNVSVMGFSPVLNLSRTRTRSNVAQYDTKAVEVKLGLQSQF
jgi:Surface lipoprotein assembly modifier